MAEPAATKMTACLDSSVVIAWLFEGAPAAWAGFQKAIASELLRAEVFRALDRARILGHVDDATRAAMTTRALALLHTCDLYPVSASVLDRVAGPFPTVIRTLDAVHLATALLWREAQDEAPAVLTLDRQLRIAAEALGFEVQPR